GKKDVVPYYADEVKAALAVRGTSGDLIRVLGARMEKIRDAEPEDVQWNAQQLEKELDIFGKTPAYRALRAQDKRQVIEFRSALGELAQKHSLPKKALIEQVEPFTAFVQGLQSVNKRDLLVEHDREVCAGVGVK